MRFLRWLTQPAHGITLELLGFAVLFILLALLTQRMGWW
jgi:hypothetical protein